MLTSTLLALTVWSASLPLQAGGNDPGMRPRATQYFDPRRPGHGIDLSYLGTDSTGTAVPPWSSAITRISRHASTATIFR